MYDKFFHKFYVSRSLQVPKLLGPQFFLDVLELHSIANLKMLSILGDKKGSYK